MTWQCRRCGRTVDLVLRDGDRCAAPPARCGSAPAGRCRTTTARPTFGSSRCVSCCNRRRLRLAMPARRMLSGKPSTRREVISGTLRHEGARRSRALRAVPPDVHLIPRREQRRPRAGGPVSKLTELAVIGLKSPATNLPSPAPGERVSGREKQARNPGRCEPAGPNSSRPNPTSAGGSTARYSRPRRPPGRNLRALRPEDAAHREALSGGPHPAASRDTRRPRARRSRTG